MTSVVAKHIAVHSSGTGEFVNSPTTCPIWLSPHRDYLNTYESEAGYTTVWSTYGTTRLSFTDSQRPHGACLAHFRPITPLHEPKTANSRMTSLVISSKRFIFVSSPAADVIRTSLSDPIANLSCATNLFPCPSGVIIQSSEPPYYHYLSHPLQRPIPFNWPPGNSILQTFLDVPLIVTRSDSVLTVWSCAEIGAVAEPLSFISPSGNILNSVNLELTRLFETSVYPEKAVSAFLSHDVHGLLALCIVSNSVLTGLSVTPTEPSKFKVLPSFRIRDVTSAVPVLAVRRPHDCLDILVQHSDRSLSLFMGRSRLCAVHLSDPSGISFPDSSLGQAVADEFSVLNSDGYGSRFSLAQACFCSPLVNDCLASLTFAFEKAGAVTRIANVYHDLLSARANVLSTSTAFNSRNLEWTLLESVLLKVASPSLLASNDEPHVAEIELPDLPSSYDEKIASDSDWLLLLSSDYHVQHSSVKTIGPLPPEPDETRSDARVLSTSDCGTHQADILRQVLGALHLLYEDWKLRSLSGSVCRQIASLNHRLAYVLHDFAVVDYYQRDYPDLIYCYATIGNDLFSTSNVNIPSITEYLSAKMTGKRCYNSSYPSTSFENLECGQELHLAASWRKRSPFDLTQRIITYYDILFGDKSLDSDDSSRCERVLCAMVNDNVTPADIDSLSFGVALPLRDALWNCREQPNPSWPHAAFALVGREDLFNFADVDQYRKFETQSSSTQLVYQSRAMLQIHAAAATTEGVGDEQQRNDQSKKVSSEDVKPFVEAEGDGCDLEAAIFKLRFCEDKRVEEVRRILRSTEPVMMSPLRKCDQDDTPDFDVIAELKRRLEVLLRKRLAAPVGRGAFTLRTFVPTDPTKPLPIPNICIRGNVFGQKGTKVTCNPNEITRLEWGEFHNSVAAGLRIVYAETSKGGETRQIMTRSWIVHHRRSESFGNATHAGMLLAFGLGGYLPVLRKTDYIQYLVPRHELTAIGLMLGLSAGNLGSADEKITKMLCLHIRPFNETGFAVPDFHVSVNVQSAAVLGLGFLHVGSCEQSFLDGLFSVLGHRPKPGDPVDNREGLALAAGFAIGLIRLGHGSSTFNVADRKQVDRLILYANGGSQDELNIVDSHSAPNMRKADSATNQERNSTAATESETSRVLEGNHVNTDVVSPGALMAIALIYLKTGKKHIADRLVVPDSLYSLGKIRPDHVFLKVLTRSLIMWDHIEASVDYIRRTLPRLLLPVNNSNDLFDLQGRVNVNSLYCEDNVDVSGILQARGFAIAGVCTAIALKFAGTNDPKAVDLIVRECEAFERAFESLELDEKALECVYTTGLCCAVLALGVVSAGSGDLEVFRLLRRLRKKGGRSQFRGRYGSYMAVHMAIGFLFLGGGCQTFGTSDEAVATLLCAIYPQFPYDVDDNRYHLQAFRHLYVLATEPRCVETRDVDTGMWCSADIELVLKNGTIVKKRAPCIVPEAKLIEEIRVVSERYLRTKAAIRPAAPGKGWYSNSRGQVIFIKRKTGHLPFSLDPKGSKGILARSLNRPKPNAGESGDEAYFLQMEHLVKAFSADPEILAFVKYFCSPGSNHANKHGEQRPRMADEKAKRFVEMLYECLSNDKADAVKIYLDMERAVEAVERRDASPSMTDSLILIEKYIYSERVCSKRLIRTDFVARLLLMVRQMIGHPEVRQALLRYIESGGHEWSGSGRTVKLCHRENRTQALGDENRIKIHKDLAMVLRLNGFPELREMEDLTEWIKSMKNNPSTEPEEINNKVWNAVDGRLTQVCDVALESLFDSLLHEDTVEAEMF